MQRQTRIPILLREIKSTRERSDECVFADVEGGGELVEGCAHGGGSVEGHVVERFEVRWGDSGELGFRHWGGSVKGSVGPGFFHAWQRFRALGWAGVLVSSSLTGRRPGWVM